MPAAIVVDATRADQQAWRGTIGELAADAPGALGRAAGAPGLSNDNPGSIVIGRVAALDLTDVNLTDVASGFSRTSKERRNASN
jgi:siroheme synthase